MCMCVSEMIHRVSPEVERCSCPDLQIINLGKRLTDFGTATLDIDWPKETENEKWLLYLMRISSTGVDHIECSPEGEINHLKLVSENVAFRYGGPSSGTYSLVMW